MKQGLVIYAPPWPGEKRASLSRCLHLWCALEYYLFSILSFSAASQKCICARLSWETDENLPQKDIDFLISKLLIMTEIIFYPGILN